jgi:hypothetical protein
MELSSNVVCFILAHGDFAPVMLYLLLELLNITLWEAP